MLINGNGPNIYINGAGVISPQQTYDNEAFLPEVTEYGGNVLTCIQPNFKDYINPFQMRRLSRMLRMGLSAATICLQNARLETPDAIITATGYGFQEDMGKFLLEILQQNEQQLTPTYFMQSTYNALSGLIALTVKCMGYNNTYAGRGFAFETAVQDAMLLVREKEAENVLVGSFDQAHHVQYSDYARLGYVKKEKTSNLKLFESRTQGTLQGEGMAFFTVSGQAFPHSWCLLQSLHTVYRPADFPFLCEELTDFLQANGIGPEDIDVFVNGASGDIVRDKWSMELRKKFFSHAAEVLFKHLTGEYATASSFGVWLGARILKTRTIPESVLADPATSGRPLRTVLVCNHFLDRNYSFFLLTGRTPSIST
ncbi:3-oxoacyl-(acyl-carrier-protein) synthase [Desulfosalsimonas propionicica]|uniref:3-oxoacyl-(Acyl-carrier-protein) synthase n=1 Tax=Desulfosalsimonas propionicica TaxID=332175 RepID=A0A7W0HM86_9BACT|nr:beta-ketoacyl synthase chain length factor [Desulfosalsimonas propionicica]MBA2883098.1 3-oxoacyl-(acyl-carrier-protein) synthase [Desulfosalsimonas propionicica]